MLWPDTELPPTSTTCATNGIVAPAATLAFVAGWVVNVTVLAAPATMLNALLVAGVAAGVVLSVALSVYAVPTLFSDTAANVALPLASLVTGFVVTDNVEAPGLFRIESAML